MELTPTQMREWGRHAHGSPLYAQLTEVVADSDDLMRVLNRIENRPRANVLFAAVHYLLLDGFDDLGLVGFYRSLVSEPSAPDGVAGPFRRFVLENEEAIVELGRTRYTQTNEARRCVALLPAIWQAELSRFHLVDVGTSAGLNLLVDRYGYRWNGVEWGSAASTLTLEADVRGQLPDPIEIEVLSRTGLDLHPVDAGNPEDRRWLEALIWPEHLERRRRLVAALDMAGDVEMELVAGSAMDTLGPALGRLPAGEPAVVINSFTLNQFTQDQRDRLATIVADTRGQRPVARVFLEHLDRDDDWPSLGIEVGSGLEIIGRAHPHGEWVEFYARP